MKLIDISRTLTPALAVWPGDQPFAAEWTARIESGSSVNLSALTFSTHAGTHADAPLHYRRDGAPIDAIPLDHFIGPVQVVDVGDVERIGLPVLGLIDAARAPRVLFRTRASTVPDDRWDGAFASFDPALIDALAARGVVLIGTDAPSVDPVDSHDLPAHQALARGGIVNLENLRLAEVPPGFYELLALPLRVHGLDAAPVRAVLRSAEGEEES